MRALVNLNGHISSPEEAKVSIFDRGFLFGDGVYETGTAYQRCPLFLEEHLARLRKSSGRLFIPFTWTDEDVCQRLFSTARQFGRAEFYFRIIVTRGVVPHVSLDCLSDLKPTLAVIVSELNVDHYDKLRKSGLQVLTSKIIRNSALAQDPNIKTSNYLNSLLALQEVKGRGADDAVLCDIHQNVAEGTTFSVFGVTKNGTLITPSLDVGILDSITRRHVLGLAKNSMETKEGFFPLAEFKASSEVFVASSVREIVPVTKWDEGSYGVGPVTQTLQAALKNQIADYISTHTKV